MSSAALVTCSFLSGSASAACPRLCVSAAALTTCSTTPLTTAGTRSALLPQRLGVRCASDTLRFRCGARDLHTSPSSTAGERSARLPQRLGVRCTFETLLLLCGARDLQYMYDTFDYRCTTPSSTPSQRLSSVAAPETSCSLCGARGSQFDASDSRWLARSLRRFLGGAQLN